MIDDLNKNWTGNFWSDWNGDFWDGINSGFPLCCIIFFCDIWCPLRISKRMFSGKESRDWRSHVGYVQCPECIIRWNKS